MKPHDCITATDVAMAQERMAEAFEMRAIAHEAKVQGDLENHLIMRQRAVHELARVFRENKVIELQEI